MRGKIGYHQRSHLPYGSDPVVRNEIAFYEVVPTVGNPTSGTQGMTWTKGAGNSGPNLLDFTTWGGPTGPAVITPGMYAINARVGAQPSPVVAWAADSNGMIDLFTNSEPSPANDWGQQATNSFPLDVPDDSGGIGTVGFTRYLVNGATGFTQFLELQFYAPGTYTASGFVSVQRIF